MSEQSGPLGDGGSRAGKGNMRLVRRAIREGWPITPEMKAELAKQMSKVVAKGKSNRDKAAAARVLVAAEGQNIRRAELALKFEDQTGEVVSTIETHEHNHLHIHGDVDVQRARFDALAERLGIAGDVECPAIGQAEAVVEAVEGTLADGPANTDGADSATGGFSWS
jgi:hypothetical protein